MSNEILKDQFPSSYSERWVTPQARELLRRHFVEQLAAGMYDAYNATLESRLGEDDDTTMGEGFTEMLQSLPSAEALFAYVADSAGEFAEDRIETAIPLALIKVNPITGKQLAHSFESVIEVRDGEIVEVFSAFTQEQGELALRQANEQITIGLHPGNVYSESWY